MAYGSGSIYQRGRFWWISYAVNGKQVNESSKSTERKDADKLLKKRMGELSSNRAVGGSARVLTVPDLLSRLQAEYVEQERRSLRDLKNKIALASKRLAGVRASEFGSDHIRRLKSAMKAEGAENATINRYLALIRRAFNLAAQNDPPLVGRVPHFELLPEAEPRSGFITDTEYRTLLSHLPEHVRGLLVFGYHLGMRKTALLNIQRSWVDLKENVIRTQAPRGAKKQGKVLPVYGDMLPWLELEMARETDSRYLFLYKGSNMADFKRSWATACKAAGLPGLLFHDLRRSAVRNMERAGVPRSVAMAITGHKTESVYKRYAIVAEQDVKAAGEKMARIMETTAETTAKESSNGQQVQ